MSRAGYSGLTLGLLVTLGCGGITQPLGDVAGSSSGGNSSGSDSDNGSSEGGQSDSSSGQGGSQGGRAGSPSPAPGSGPLFTCETPCLEKILTGSALSCKLCHTSKTTDMMGLQSSGLDLESPNVTARLKDVPAKHTDIVTPMGAPGPSCPSGDMLINSAAPDESWLLKKVKGQQGTCGTQMPQPPTVLKADEMTCMETYIYCVAGL